MMKNTVKQHKRARQKHADISAPSNERRKKRALLQKNARQKSARQISARQMNARQMGARQKSTNQLGLLGLLYFIIHFQHVYVLLWIP